MRSVLVGLIAGALLGFPSASSAQPSALVPPAEPPPPSVVPRNSVFITDANQLSLGVVVPSYNDVSTRYSLRLRPTVDVLIGEHFTFGGQLDFGYASGRPGDTWQLGGSVRLGGYVPLGKRTALWPLLAAGMTKVSDVGNDAPSYSALHLHFELPLLVHLARGFFVGAGPLVGSQLSIANDKSSDVDTFLHFGLTTVLGGWF